MAFGTGAGPFKAEVFVEELAVEAFRDAILPGLARGSINAVPIRCDDPGQQTPSTRTRDAAQKARCTPAEATRTLSGRGTVMRDEPIARP